MTTKKRILLVAGGTGGHVFPALALAEHLCKKHTLFLVTDARGATYLCDKTRAYFLRILVIPAAHFHGRVLHKLLSLVKFAVGAFLTPLKLWPLKADHALGFGGFLTFWPILWSRLFRTCVALYQADSVAGQANRMLQHFSHKVFASFPNVPGISASKCTHIGFLTRSSFQKTPYPKIDDTFHLLVIGGSQGAAVFNTLVPKAIAALPSALQKKLRVYQQCSTTMQKTVRSTYAKKTLASVTLSPFIANMNSALQSAHLVITRAGASTIGELAAVGRPAIFIPYPYAKDNHQEHNARYICDHVRGGICLLQKKLTEKTLAVQLATLMEAPGFLKKSATAMGNLSRDSLEKITAYIEH